MNSWFKRHLNWTWVFGWLLINALAFISISLVLSLISTDCRISSVIRGGVRFLVAMYSAILMLVISGWVIEQKGHSLLWLFLYGFWSPVWLSNNRTIVKEQLARLRREKRKLASLQ
jgi:hypothetical protein